MRLRFLTLCLSMLTAATQAGQVEDIQAKIKTAKLADKHIWIQLLDDTSIFAQDSARFEEAVFTPHFVRSLRSDFSVIEIRSSEVSTDADLKAWVSKFMPEGMFATILLDSLGKIYVKQNPTLVLNQLLAKKTSLRGAQKYFRTKARELKAKRSPFEQVLKMNARIKALPFLQEALAEARRSGQTLLINLAPQDTAAAAQFIGRYLAILFKRQSSSGRDIISAATREDATALSRPRLVPNLPSIVRGPPPAWVGNTTPPEQGFLVYNVESTNNTHDLRADHVEFFRLIGLRPQAVLAVMQPNGRVDGVVNPTNWISRHRQKPGGFLGLSDVELLGDWAAAQPAKASEAARAKYCGGILNLLGDIGS